MLDQSAYPLLRLAVFLLAAGWVHGSSANAQVPVWNCSSGDSSLAQSAFEEGREHLRASRSLRIAGRTDDADREARAALEAFRRQCEAGNDYAIHWQSMAYLALGDWVMAADALDAFLAVHSEDELPPSILHALARNREDAMSRVLTLSIRTAPGATVRLPDDRVRAAERPIRIDQRVPEDFQLVVEADGHRPRTLDRAELGLGGSEAGLTVSLRVELERIPEVVSQVRDRSDPDPAESARFDVAPLLITAAAGAGAFLVVGIAGSVWAEDRATVYNSSCLTMPMLMGCDAVRSEFEVADALRIASFTISGVFLVAGITVWVVDAVTR